VSQAFDPYRTLQVDPAAEDVVIQAAYRALMKRYHPDHGGSLAVARDLNEAYAAIGDPAARRAWERAHRFRRAASDLSARPATAAGPGGRRDTARSLEAELGPEVLRRFVPFRAAGPGWLFDFSATLKDAPRHRIWMKRFPHQGAADARAFLTMVEATRLARPLWKWGSDLFVAVLPGFSESFEATLRGPRGPLASFGHAVAALDLTTRMIHTARRGRGLPTVAALTAALALAR
jgi:hypothetical protein